MTYPVIDLQSLDTVALEALGTKQKYWYFFPADNTKRLFKIGREGTGENWSEKAACELARLLDLPHAEYDFATDGVDNGILSPSFLAKNESLIHGNELLAKFTNTGGETRIFHQRYNTIDRVFLLTENVPPPIASSYLKNGADFFVGYLLLDAWIGNQDRHAQNWGLIASLPLTSDLDNREAANTWLFRLAPTYDHASSLGRELSDSKRMELLTSKNTQSNLETYLRKSRSALFSTQNDKKALGTLVAFEQFSLRRKDAALFWLDRLLVLDSNRVYGIFTQMPDSHMSEAAKQFACRMLDLNKASLEEIRRRLSE